MALVFGGIVWFVWGGGFAQEYLAGYITEKALSIDNLFVFVIMMSSFKVPRKYQQEVLLAGIVIALVLRLIFILAGAALIENFSWVFYFFGAWLLWTAFSQAREGVQEPDDDDEEYRPSGFVKLIADGEFGELIGGHMVGSNVSELLPELTLAQRFDLTAEEIGRNVHTHPTLSEAMKEAAEGIGGHMINL